MSKKGILLITSETYPAGAGDGRSAYYLAESLRGQCMVSKVLTLRAPEYAGTDDDHIISTPYFFHSLLGKIVSRLFFFKKLLVQGRKFKVWMVYGRTLGNRIAIILGAILGKRVVFRSTLWGFDSISSLTRRNPFNRFIYSLAWGYWGLNESFIDDYNRVIEKKRVFQSPQGVPNIFFSNPASSKDELRSKLGLPNNIPILISVGHIIQRKGFPEIFHWLSGVEHDFIYLLVGENSPSRTSRLYRKWLEMEHLQQQGKELLGNRIRFVGPKSNVLEYLNASDIFLHGAYAEGFPPNSLNEAMACGLPCLVRGIEGIDKELEEGSGIQLFSNKQQFTKGIEDLIDSADLRNILGNKTRVYAEKHFRIENVASNLIRFVYPHSL